MHEILTHQDPHKFDPDQLWENLSPDIFDATSSFHKFMLGDFLQALKKTSTNKKKGLIETSYYGSTTGNHNSLINP